jgi:hypothetical protein
MVAPSLVDLNLEVVPILEDVIPAGRIPVDLSLADDQSREVQSREVQSREVQTRAVRLNLEGRLIPVDAQNLVDRNPVVPFLVVQNLEVQIRADGPRRAVPDQPVGRMAQKGRWELDRTDRGA